MLESNPSRNSYTSAHKYRDIAVNKRELGKLR
jgi:hypothetical protein